MEIRLITNKNIYTYIFPFIRYFKITFKIIRYLKFGYIKKYSKRVCDVAMVTYTEEVNSVITKNL